MYVLALQLDFCFHKGKDIASYFFVVPWRLTWKFQTDILTPKDSGVIVR